MTDSSPVAEIPEWPKRVVCYIHGDDESLWVKAREIDLPEEAHSMFSHALDEFKLLLEVKEDGTAKVIALDDKPVLDSYMAQRFNALEDSHAQR